MRRGDPLPHGPPASFEAVFVRARRRREAHVANQPREPRFTIIVRRLGPRVAAVDRPRVPQHEIAGVRAGHDGRSEAGMVTGRFEVIVAPEGVDRSGAVRPPRPEKRMRAWHDRKPPPARGIRPEDVDEALRALEPVPVRTLVDVEPTAVPLAKAGLPPRISAPRPPGAHGVEANEELVRPPKRREDVHEGRIRSHEPGEFALSRSLPGQNPTVHGDRPRGGPRGRVATTQSVADGLGPIPEKVVCHIQCVGVENVLDDGVALAVEILSYFSVIIGTESWNVDHGKISSIRVIQRHGLRSFFSDLGRGADYFKWSSICVDVHITQEEKRELWLLPPCRPSDSNT